jgi:hypothetical protein
LWSSEDVVRTPTRTLLATGAILIGVAAAAAQAPGPRRAVLISEGSPASFALPGRSPAAVIERLLSFDVNADGRISRDELPERMLGLVARGDRNADAALDSNEIRALVNAESSGSIRVSFRSQSSEGLPGVVHDLKLSPAKHLRALVIVGAQKPPRSADDPASRAFLGEMKALLDDEEYENFIAAATRLSRSADLRFRTIGGVVGGLAVPAGRK